MSNLRSILIASLLMIVIVTAPAVMLGGDCDDEDDYCTVTFMMPDGTVAGVLMVKSGTQINLDEIPDPILPKGATFAGWGDVTKIITEDTVFTAMLEYDSAPYAVRYLAEQGGACIHTEFVYSGQAAKYDLIPEKPATNTSYYTFKEWSEDLSKVTRDMEVYPIFESSERLYEVRFHDYDRSLLDVKYVPYGSTLKDMPEEPSRSSTVAYEYTFKMWSITPNGGSPASFDNITDTRFVYAYYEPTLMVYTVSFILDGEIVSTKDVTYNTQLGSAAPLDLFAGEALALMYRDSGHTKSFSTSYIIIGNTNVYIEKAPGVYDSERDEKGGVTGDIVYVKQTDKTLVRIALSDGAYTVCDISQFSNGMTASIDRESVKRMASFFGDDAVLRISVPRGMLLIHACDLVGVLGDSDAVTLNVTNGPSGVKTTAALKSINYSGYYSMNLKSDNHRITEIEGKVTASFPLVLAEGLNPAAWTITSKGDAVLMKSSYSNQRISIETGTVQFFAVGTDTIGSGELAEKVVMPYGEVEYSIVPATDYGGPSGVYVSVLESVEADCAGNILFIPSSVGGKVLMAVSEGAFNSVKDASALVIPETVASFSWGSWVSGIPVVYFMGDAPEFIGDVPSIVTVHGLPSHEGWEGEESFTEYTYTGSYKKDPFAFTFVIIDGEIMINRYISGTYIEIPDAISADGSDYPVCYVGDAAFMRSADKWFVESYGLRYESYAVDTVDIPDSVREVMARSFYGSTLKNIYGAGFVDHIWDEAFKGCSSLAVFTIPDSVLYIGHGAFQACSSKSFSRITLSDNVQYLGESAFYGCSGLRNIRLSESLIEIPQSCFAQCTMLTSIEIPVLAKSIGDNAFYNCGSLLYIDLMNVETVGSSAFQSPNGSSKLECIVFGDYLTALGKSAFGNCIDIAEIEAYCPMPAGMEEAFPGVELHSVKYYVADGLQDSWSVFEDVVVIENTMKDEKDYTITNIVIGMILMFLVLGGVSFLLRMRK